MHAGVRRMPAERARHAKRLGHVQPVGVLAAPADSGSTTSTTQSPTSAATTSSQALSTTTSAKQSSSSAPSSSSPTQSSSASSAPTSSASSTSSLAPSTNTQSPSATALSSSLVTSPTTSTSTSLASLSTSTPQNAAAATNSGLSGGALAGIIAGSVIVGVALIVFFVRKTYLRRREPKRISWNDPDPRLDDPLPLPDVSERPSPLTTAANIPQRSAPLSPFEAHGQHMYPAPVPPVMHMHPPATPTYAAPTPPPATYNNPTPVATYPTQPVSSAYGFGGAPAHAMAQVASTLPSVRAQHAPMEAMVKCTFVPTLPDELSITTGERVFIVEQYDDGWDMCMNGRGERGMVPRECLEHAPSDQPDLGWGNVKRISSLNPDGRRY